MTTVSSKPDVGSGRGNTVPAENRGRVPRTPNEHDESADSQTTQEPSSRRVGKQGLQDVQRGLVDTGTGPEIGATYDKVRRTSEP